MGTLGTVTRDDDESIATIHRAIERPVMKVRNVLRGCRLYA